MKKLLFLLLLPAYCFSQSIDTTIIVPPSTDTTKIRVKSTTTVTQSAPTVVTVRSVTITKTGTVTPPIPPDTTVVVTGTVYFKGDFTKKNGGWVEPSSKTITGIVQNGTTWHGLTAALCTISNKDMEACTIGDCNRMEIAELPNDKKGGINDEATYVGKTVWYGWSIKINSSFGLTKHYWWIPLQLHGDAAFQTNPLMAIDLGSGSWNVNIRGGDYTKNGNKGYPFINNSISYGKWTDIIIGINYQKTATGSITIYRRDEGQTKFTVAFVKTDIPTVQTNSAGYVGYPFWKSGIYRYDIPTPDSVYEGPFSRGSTFSAVEKASFNTQNGF